MHPRVFSLPLPCCWQASHCALRPTGLALYGSTGHASAHRTILDADSSSVFQLPRLLSQGVSRNASKPLTVARCYLPIPDKECAQPRSFVESRAASLFALPGHLSSPLWSPSLQPLLAFIYPALGPGPPHRCAQAPSLPAHSRPCDPPRCSSTSHPMSVSLSNHLPLSHRHSSHPHRSSQRSSKARRSP